MATKLRLHKTEIERIQREQEAEAQAQAEIEAQADAEILTIAETWQLDPREVEVVLSKYRALYTRAKQAARDIEKRGLVSFDNYGRSRANPSVSIEKDSIQAMARLLKLLNIGMNEPEPDSQNQKMRPWGRT
jgi:hypothetical protein